MFQVVSIIEAKNLIRKHISTYQLQKEEVKLLDALNRTLAVDIEAKCDVPHFHRSTVDGYAVKSKDVEGATESLPSFLKIIGEVKMGRPPEEELKQGETIYVPTGGAIPIGCDGMVMVEDTEKMNDELFVYKKIAPRENILFRGEDITCGEKVLTKGTKITPQVIGVLSAIGYDKVFVYQPIKYTIISTGDEIVAPHVTPKVGEIRDINSYTISTVINDKYGDIVAVKVISDDEEKLKEAMMTAINESDVLIISGGSSVGQKDLTYKLLDDLKKDSVFVHGIAIKPGKPTIFAKVKNKLVFGLPGQPASALMVFKTFINEIEDILYHRIPLPAFYVEAKLTKNIHATPGRETYQMVQLIQKEDGYYAEPIFGKSGTITLISKANGFVKISSKREGISVGEKVKVYQL